MSIIFDIAFAAVIIIAFAAGYHRGLVKSVWRIAALIITIILVTAFNGPAADYLSGTKLPDIINTKISQSASIPHGGGVDISDVLNLPEFLKPQIDSAAQGAQNVAASVNDAAAAALTSVFITIITSICLFIIIRLLLSVIYLIISAVAKLPVIKGVNKLTGGILGVINAVFIVFLLLGLTSLFAPADSGLFDAINDTYIVKYLYNYNILLQIFMKI